MVPRYSSGASMVSRSKGSCTLPLTSRVTTCGLPTVSSKPSRRICSTRIASASSPRPWTSQASGRSVGRTRSDTLPTSSASRRSLTRRAVTLAPLTLPTSGEVLVPMVIEIAGSSTWMSGSATGFSASARVSPMVISGMPAMATMSPGPADSPGLRSRPSVTSSSVMRTFLTVAVATHPGHGLALLQGALVDAQQREAAEERRRVEVGDVGLQRRALVVLRGGDRLEDRLEERLEVGALGHRAVLGLLERGDAGLAGGVDDREVERVLAVGLVEQVHEELVGLVDDLGDAGVAAVGLVDDQDHRHVGVERLAQHEAGLGERALGGVDEQHDAVDHGQAALDLATEVGVAGGVDDVDDHRLAAAGRTGVVDRGVLREDRDALLALEVAGVHDAVGHALGLVRGERAGLAEHRVDQRGLAVVDVGDDRDVAQVGAGLGGHAGAFRAEMRWRRG